MISFVLAVISGWLLITLFLHKQNGTVPEWMHKLMHEDRYVRDPKKADHLRVSVWVWPTVFFLLMGPFFILYFFYGLANPYETWRSFGHNTFLSTSAVVLGLFFTFYLAMNIRNNFDKYSVDLVDKEKKDKIKEVYGARELATESDLKKLASPSGFYIGAPYLHWFGDGHFITVGGAGSGKNAAIIMPGYLSPAFTATGTSIFALDPKGESYAVCKDELIRKGYNVYRLNPTDIFKMGTNHFNLFDVIQYDSPDVASFCRSIAASLAPIKGGHSTSDHFNDKAQGLLFCYMLHMLDKLKSGASFVVLYDWVTLAGKKRLELLTEMSNSTAYEGVIANEAGSLLAGFEFGGGEETSSIFSTAQKALKSFRDLEFRRIGNRSDFSLNELIDKPTALFINIEFGNLESSAGWIRSMIGILSRMMEKRQSRDRRLLIMLDEFVQLGYVKEVEAGFVTLRGFGVSYHIVIQDLQQIQHIYPGSYKSFFSSSAVKHILNVEDEVFLTNVRKTALVNYAFSFEA